MHFITHVAKPLLLAALVVAKPISLNGTWLQLYSNGYVQSTSEIDWRCVRVQALVDGSDLSIQKTASLHGGPISVTSPLIHARLLDDNKFAVPTSLRSSVTYDVHVYDNNTVVITAEQTPALYVWTRPFPADDDDPIDVPRLAAFTQRIGFESNDPYYNRIVQTYNNTQCI